MAYIKATDLTVEFPLYATPNRSLKNTIISSATGGRIASESGKHSSVIALDKLNFEFKEGDRVGLLGHNGAGKTTLLRTLAGAYEPTSGRLERQGRVVSLIDISMGMDHDATGYENILLRGVTMGMSLKEIRKKTPKIAEFTELGDFLNMPVRTYSSGMKLRLAFAVSTSMQADILIMDEWLSVGDAAFNQKASDRLQGLVDKTGILILATHSKDLSEKICNQSIKMEHGKMDAVL